MSSLIDSYDEWLQQLKKEYDFAKSCIKTINDFCDKINKKEDDISKTFNSFGSDIEGVHKFSNSIYSKNTSDKTKQKIKIITNVKKYLILLCELCDSNTPKTFLKYNKPFLILKLIHITIIVLYKNRNKKYPELTEKQKELINIEENIFRKSVKREYDVIQFDRVLKKQKVMPELNNQSYKDLQNHINIDNNYSPEIQLLCKCPICAKWPYHLMTPKLQAEYLHNQAQAQEHIENAKKVHLQRIQVEAQEKAAKELQAQAQAQVIAAAQAAAAAQAQAQAQAQVQALSIQKKYQIATQQETEESINKLKQQQPSMNIEQINSHFFKIDDIIVCSKCNQNLKVPIRCNILKCPYCTHDNTAFQVFQAANNKSKSNLVSVTLKSGESTATQNINVRLSQTSKVSGSLQYSSIRSMNKNHSNIKVKYTDNKIYDAHIIDERDDVIKIHYRGWNAKWDEWIDKKSDRLIMS